MKVLAFYITYTSKITRAAFILASWLVILLIVLTAQQVISRYFFNFSSIALQELQWYLFGFIMTLSIAHTLEVNGHVRVDVLSNSFSTRGKVIVQIIGLLLLIPLSITLFYCGLQDVISARSFHTAVPSAYYSTLILSEDFFFYPFMAGAEQILRATLLVGEGSADAGGLEARWIIRAAFPFGMLLLTMQSISLLLRCCIPSLRSVSGSEVLQNGQDQPWV